MGKTKDLDVIRLSFNMKSFLVRIVDDYASELGISRPAALSVIISQWNDYRKGVNSIGNFGEFLNQVKNAESEKVLDSDD